MHLVPKPIPEHFLKALPDGIKFVRKHHQDFLVAESLACPRGHGLMSEDVRIHGEPSIRLRIEIGRGDGLIFIDAFWGGHAKLYSFVPDLAAAGPLVKAFCPVCGADMLVPAACAHPGCTADRAIVFHLPGGANKIYVCARLGCPGHRMDIVHVARRVLAQVGEIQFEGPRAEDLCLEI